MAQEDEAIRIDWAFICDYALIDSLGKISVIGIFDRLFAPTLPAVHPLVYLAASWVAPPGQVIAAELRIWSPAKELIASMPQQLAFGPEGRSTGIFQISPLGLSTIGEYVFDLLGAGRSIRQLRLTVAQQQAQPQ